MDVEPSPYEPLTSPELVVCTICWAAVGFGFMVQHTAWHRAEDDDT